MGEAKTTFTHDSLQRIVIYTCVIYIAYRYLSCFLVFLYSYPRGYVWEELFLNYQAGFLRRGLLGAIAYALSPAVKPVAFFATAIGTGYCLTLRLGANFFGKFDPLVIILAFASPALLAFPTYSVSTLGRKDLFITLFTLFLAKFADVEARKDNPHSRIRPIYGMFVIGASVCILIHELEAFFVPVQLFIMAVLLWRTGRIRDIIACSCAAAAVLFFLCVSFFLFPVPPDAGGVICRSWANTAVDLSCQTLGARFNPFTWISITPKEGLKLALSIMTSPVTVVSYALGLFLGLVPAIVTSRMYGQQHFATVLGKSLFLRALYTAGMLVPFGLFFAGMDYGRWINLLSVHTLVAACAIILFALSPQELEMRNNTIHNIRLAAMADRPWLCSACAFLLIVYVAFWRMEHFVPAGTFALRGMPFQAVAALVATVNKFLP